MSSFEKSCRSWCCCRRTGEMSASSQSQTPGQHFPFLHTCPRTAHALPTLPCSLLTLILRVPKTICIVKRSPQYLYDSSWPLPSNRICTPLTVASGIKRPISSPPGSEAYLSSRGFRYSTVGNCNVLMIDNLVSKIYLYFCANEWYEPGSVVIDFQVRH
jgi:hypothetical protein